jgi:hypothetical protein
MLRNFIVISPYGFEFGAALEERSPPSETNLSNASLGNPASTITSNDLLRNRQAEQIS